MDKASHLPVGTGTGETPVLRPCPKWLVLYIKLRSRAFLSLSPATATAPLRTIAYDLVFG